MNVLTDLPAKSAVFLSLTMLFLCLAAKVHADEITAHDPVDTGFGNAAGQVTLPLEEYQRLLLQATTHPLPAPSGYAIGQSQLNVIFHQSDSRVTATVHAEVEVETFENEWTLVALLGPGAALESASINGAAVQLVQRAEGLFWLAEKRQKATVSLTYHVDSRFTERSYITSLPVPRGAATRFALEIPQTHIDLAVAPAANLVISENDSGTSASGTLPSTSSMMVSWRVAAERQYVLSRADYTGASEFGAIAWHATIDAELLIDGEVTVPLVSTAATLLELQVDGEPASVFSEEGRFAVRLSGAGKHRIDLSFLSVVSYPEGVPSTGFDIPDVPVSKFQLTLEGDKLVQATPLGGGHPTVPGSVEIKQENGTTVATFSFR